VTDHAYAYAYVRESNKQRQKILALEKKWPTKDCWFRLLTTLVGMCVAKNSKIVLPDKMQSSQAVKVKYWSESPIGMVIYAMILQTSSQREEEMLGNQSNTIVMFAGSILVKRAQHNTIKQHSAVSLAKCHYVKRTGVVMRLATIYHVWMSTLKRIVKQLDALELIEISTCSQKKYKLTFIGQVGDLTEHLFKCEPNILVA
jgi:hypothetical protein